MYIAFFYKNGGNNYVTMNNKAFCKMLMKYEMEQIGARSFRVGAEKRIKKDYGTIKAELREIAISWQYNFNRFNYDYFDLSGWNNFFEEYGRKYGLLKEYKENGIL